VGAAEVIVDSSSLIAVLNREPDAHLHIAAMAQADRLLMAAPTRVEAAIVAGRIGLQGIDEFLEASGIEFTDFTAEHAAVACAAHARYGRGSGSPAKLNFGDCMAYAVAKVLDQPLLFKGDHFTHTDIEPALRD
jgi:ribonuclease VapC